MKEAIQIIERTRKANLPFAFLSDVDFVTLAKLRKSYDIKQGWNNPYLTGCSSFSFGYLIKLLPPMIKFEFRGYTIESETDPWPVKCNLLYRYYMDEKIYHTSTIEEAIEEIIDRTELDEIKQNSDTQTDR